MVIKKKRKYFKRTGYVAAFKMSNLDQDVEIDRSVFLNTRIIKIMLLFYKTLLYFLITLLILFYLRKDKLAKIFVAHKNFQN